MGALYWSLLIRDASVLAIARTETRNLYDRLTKGKGLSACQELIMEYSRAWFFKERKECGVT